MQKKESRQWPEVIISGGDKSITQSISARWRNFFRWDSDSYLQIHKIALRKLSKAQDPAPVRQNVISRSAVHSWNKL